MEASTIENRSHMTDALLSNQRDKDQSLARVEQNAWTDDDVEYVFDDVNNRFIKYFINLLLVGLGVGLSFAFPPFIPAIIAATVGCAGLNQLRTSNNRAHTVAKGFSLVMGALCGGMIYAVPIFGPAVLCVFAFGSACANVILYGADIPTLFDSVIHYGEDWHEKNGYQKCYSVVKNIVTTFLSVGAAYIMTSGMIAGAIQLIGVAAIMSVPYITIPIIAIAFISNLAFAKRGLDTCATLVKGFWDACCSEKKGSVWKYVFDIDRNDWNSQKAGLKIAWGALKLIGVGTICWLAQSGFVRSLAPTIAKLPFLPALNQSAAFLSTITISAITARVSLAIPKLSACVDNACYAAKKLRNLPAECKKFWKSLPSWNDLNVSQVVSNNKYKNKLKTIKNKIKSSAGGNADKDQIEHRITAEQNRFRERVFAKAKSKFSNTSFIYKFYCGLCAFKSAVVSCISPPAILVNTVANASYGTDSVGRVMNALVSQAFNENAYAQQQNEAQQCSVISVIPRKKSSPSNNSNNATGRQPSESKYSDRSGTTSTSPEQKISSPILRVSDNLNSMFAKKGGEPSEEPLTPVYIFV